MISLSPLPSAHPSCFQPTSVRTSLRCYPEFILAKGRSLTFASIMRDSTPYSDSLSLRLLLLSGLTWPRTITSRLIKQKAPRHPVARAPSACKHTVSGTFHAPYRGTFHRSVALLVHYRSSRSTQAWRVVPPCSGEISRVSPYSRPLGGFMNTGLSPSLVRLSRQFIM